MRRPGLSLGAVLFVAASVALAPLLAQFRRSWPWRVTVEGHSMEPTLRAGDWLLVDPLAYGRRTPQVGELIVARDPRLPARWLVKRVAAVDRQGRLTLAGDHPSHRQDDLPAVERQFVVGRPWLRYWPPGRIGRLT
ncbi:MAG TPA: S26 family signal peptidase [Candidatus Limnocylindria bacterium]|nr:S26 family signal peptidase [Candidatus Limnocylindria bacterium]